MVVAPGMVGELGILPLHMPLVTTLRIGELRLKHDEDKQDHIAIDGGYMQVIEDKVTILADAAEYASKMDVKELKRVKDEIKERAGSMPRDSEEIFKTAAELERITNRLSIAERRQ